MKEHPILFKGEMVRAILDGRKTQTRRFVQLVELHSSFGQPNFDKAWIDPSYSIQEFGCAPCLKIPFDYGTDNETSHRHFPKWNIGDRLWVRETFRQITSGEIQGGEGALRYGVEYKAGGTRWNAHETIMSGGWRDTERPMQFESQPWKPSIHMPRWVSRLTLEITGIRVERLQDISDEDSLAEGIERQKYQDGPLKFSIGMGDYSFNAPTAKECYEYLWQSAYGPGSWKQNPWVWVIEFNPQPTQ